MKKNILILSLVTIALSLFSSTPSFAQDCSGYALSFDSVDHQYLQYPPNGDVSGSNFLSSLSGSYTIECMVYLNGIANWQYIFSALGDNTNGTGDYFMILTVSQSGDGTYSNTPRFAISNQGLGTYHYVDASTPLTIDAWHHIAITYDATAQTLNMYIDGNLVGTTTGVTEVGNDFTSLTEAWAGRSVLNSMDPYLNGYIDEFRVSNVVRYTGSTYTVPTPPFATDANTVALYNFDEGSGQTASDATGNGNTAELGSTTSVDANDPTWVNTVGGNMCAALTPVGLSDFAGQSAKGGVQLIWNTASEQNSDYFEIQRSRSGSYFQPIGKINAAGTSSSSHSYMYTDFDPSQGINYYRLKQVDLNGKFVYSKVIAVLFGDKGSFKVYPTITSGNLNVSLPASGKVMILNMMGTEVKNMNVNGGDQQIDVSNLPSGQYIIKVAGTNKSTMFIKQ